MDVTAPRGMDVARRAVRTGMNSPVIGTSLWFAQTENAVDETIVRAQVAADAGLGNLLRTGSSDFRGTEISSTTPLPTGLPGAEPVPPILVAALGPRALEVSGRLADGILPNLAGPSVLEQHIVPVVATAARESGRPEPRIVTLVPALVTDDPDAAFDQLSTATALYDTIPSYRRVLDLGGHTRAAELGLIGDARHVADGLRRYFDAGATEIILTQTATLGPDAEKRTWEAAAGVVG